MAAPDQIVATCHICRPRSFAICQTYRNHTHNGTQAEDAYRQRDRQQKHHTARKCTKNNKGEGRPVPGCALAPRPVYLRRLRLGRLPDHPVHSVGLNLTVSALSLSVIPSTTDPPPTTQDAPSHGSAIAMCLVPFPIQNVQSHRHAAPTLGCTAH